MVTVSLAGLNLASISFYDKGTTVLSGFLGLTSGLVGLNLASTSFLLKGTT
jgi:hypothetical protein